MGDEYRVRGGVGPPLPGVVGPAGLDGRAEWVPVRLTNQLLDQVVARLGSEADPYRVVLGVFLPLRQALDGEPMAGLVEHLPPPLARELAMGNVAVGERVRSPTGAGDYLLEVSRLIQHPPWQAAPYVRAAFAAARAVLAADESEAIAARLPGDLAALWLTAR